MWTDNDMYCVCIYNIHTRNVYNVHVYVIYMHIINLLFFYIYIYIMCSTQQHYVSSYSHQRRSQHEVLYSDIFRVTVTDNMHNNVMARVVSVFTLDNKSHCCWK